MAKPILISGIQPSGKPHLGNYLGMLQRFIKEQNEGYYSCYFFVADLHSLTESFNSETKQEAVLETVALARAFGVNEKTGQGENVTPTTIFVQSAIPAHTELAVILGNLASFSELKRMTQFKDKSLHQPEDINVGLFTYPVLMAADILLYNAEVVPVGGDQLQHLELARELARKFNKITNEDIFVEPKPLLTNIPRLMSLDDPTKKMSKSHPAGCLFLDDSPEQIRNKIKRAVTDSDEKIKEDKENKPGISNLLLVYAALTNKSTKEIEILHENKSYAEFKDNLASEIIKLLEAVQKHKKTHIEDTKKAIKEGNKKANIIASKKLKEVKEKIGLVI